MPSLGELIAEKKRREQELSGLLAGRTGEVPGLRESLATGREKFFAERLGGLPARFQPAVQEVSGLQRGRLARELEPELQRTKTQRLRERSQLVYENALRQAQEAGADFRSAQEFALQQSEDVRSRAQRTEDFERKVRLAEEKERISEEFAQRGLDVEASFQQPDLFDEALSRALGTVLGTAGGYGLARSFRGRQQPQQLSPFVQSALRPPSRTFSQGLTGFTPTLRQQTVGLTRGGF